ncbi:MAG: hypothetical protein ACRD6N_10375, partial [Pyrinomonadaceae bacterium]
LTSYRTAAQKKQSVTPAPPKLTQTIARHENQRFGYGGTVTLVGAPQGSITIEGWPRNEVDVSAEIELRADTEEDLKRLATVNTFVFDQDLNHLRLLTTGTHDRVFMKRAAKDFPKKLLGLPWKVDYRIRVPLSTDLEIDAGRGPIKVTGVEGAMRLSAAESETKLVLTGGTVAATIAAGKVDVSIPVRSWRGGGADIRVAAGSLSVEFQPGFNGDIDAEVLRTGSIEDSFGALESREKPGITPRKMKARSGSGGAFFNFTIGDGMLYLKRAATSDR